MDRPIGKGRRQRRARKTPLDAADQFRANSGLKAQEYSAPVLGLIFLRFAEARFAAQRTKLEGTASSAPKPSRRGSRVDEPVAYHAEGILYLARRGAVRLPAHGRILDPACGSGGMFVSSARFVRASLKKSQYTLN